MEILVPRPVSFSQKKETIFEVLDSRKRVKSITSAPTNVLLMEQRSSNGKDLLVGALADCHFS
jgi:hypothetical protein